MSENGLLLKKHRPIEIQSANFMLTIVCGVTGFHVVKRLLKRGTFNACYCIDESLSERFSDIQIGLSCSL
jgi:hypothetical protein